MDGFDEALHTHSASNQHNINDDKLNMGIAETLKRYEIDDDYIYRSMFSVESDLMQGGSQYLEEPHHTRSNSTAVERRKAADGNDLEAPDLDTYDNDHDEFSDKKKSDENRLRRAAVDMCKIFGLYHEETIKMNKTLQNFYRCTNQAGMALELETCPDVHLHKLQQMFAEEDKRVVEKQDQNKLQDHDLRHTLRHRKNSHLTDNLKLSPIKRSRRRTTRGTPAFSLQQQAYTASQLTATPLKRFPETFTKLRLYPSYRDYNAIISLNGPSTIVIGNSLRVRFEMRFPEVARFPRPDEAKRYPHPFDTIAIVPSNTVADDLSKTTDQFLNSVLCYEPIPPKTLKGSVLFNGTMQIRKAGEYKAMFAFRGKYPYQRCHTFKVKLVDASVIALDTTVRAGSRVLVRWLRASYEVGPDDVDWIGLYHIGNTGKKKLISRQDTLQPPNSEGHLSFNMPGLVGNFIFQFHIGKFDDQVIAASDIVNSKMRLIAMTGRRTPQTEARIVVASAHGDCFSERRQFQRNVVPHLKEIAGLKSMSFTYVNFTREDHTRVDDKWIIDTVKTSLRECSCATIFVLVLGNRYGYVPPKTLLSQRFKEMHPWVMERLNYCKSNKLTNGAGASMVEMMCHQSFFAPLANDGATAVKNVYFYFRSPAIVSTEKLSAAYELEGFENEGALQDLKGRIVRTGVGNVCLAYKNAREFASIVMKDLSESIKKLAGKSADNTGSKSAIDFRRFHATEKHKSIFCEMAAFQSSLRARYVHTLHPDRFVVIDNKTGSSSAKFQDDLIIDAWLLHAIHQDKIRQTRKDGEKEDPDSLERMTDDLLKKHHGNDSLPKSPVVVGDQRAFHALNTVVDKLVTEDITAIDSPFLILGCSGVGKSSILVTWLYQLVEQYGMSLDDPVIALTLPLSEPKCGPSEAELKALEEKNDFLDRLCETAVQTLLRLNTTTRFSEKGLSCDALVTLFRSLDTDQSGFLSHEELVAAFRKLNVGLSDEEVHQLIRTINFDADQDGKTSYEEFAHALHTTVDQQLFDEVNNDLLNISRYLEVEDLDKLKLYYERERLDHFNMKRLLNGIRKQTNIIEREKNDRLKNKKTFTHLHILCVHPGESSTRFITLTDVLRFIAYELAALIPDLPRDIVTNYVSQANTDLIDHFPSFLGKVSDHGKILLCIDSIDLLKPYTLRFLDEALPPNIRVILCGSIKATESNDGNPLTNNPVFKSLKTRNWLKSGHILMLKRIHKNDTLKICTDFVEALEDTSRPDELAALHGPGAIAFVDLEKIPGDAESLSYIFERVAKAPLASNIRALRYFIASFEPYDGTDNIEQRVEEFDGFQSIVEMYDDALYDVNQVYSKGQQVLQLILLSGNGLSEEQIRDLCEEKDQTRWSEFIFAVEPHIMTRRGAFIVLENSDVEAAVLRTFKNEVERCRQYQVLIDYWELKRGNPEFLDRATAELGHLYFSMWHGKPKLSDEENEMSFKIKQDLQHYRIMARKKMWSFLTTYDSFVDNFENKIGRHRLHEFFTILPPLKGWTNGLEVIQAEFLNHFKLNRKFLYPGSFQGFQITAVSDVCSSLNIAALPHSFKIASGLVIMYKWLADLQLPMFDRCWARPPTKKHKSVFNLCLDRQGRVCSSSLYPTEPLFLLERAFVLIMGQISFNMIETSDEVISKRFFKSKKHAFSPRSPLATVTTIIHAASRIYSNELYSCAKLLLNLEHRLPVDEFPKDMPQRKKKVCAYVVRMCFTVLIDENSARIKNIVMKTKFKALVMCKVAGVILKHYQHHHGSSSTSDTANQILASLKESMREFDVMNLLQT